MQAISIATDPDAAVNENQAAEYLGVPFARFRRGASAAVGRPMSRSAAPFGTSAVRSFTISKSTPFPRQPRPTCQRLAAMDDAHELRTVQGTTQTRLGPCCDSGCCAKDNCCFRWSPGCG